MATTIGDLNISVEGLLGRKIYSALPATFYQDLIYQWYKEAFDVITDEIRKPTATVTFQTVASQSDYELPGIMNPLDPMIHDGVDGIISVEIEKVPYERGFRSELVQLYDKEWKNPPTTKRFWVEHDDDTEFLLVPALGSSDGGKNVVIVYTTSVVKPTASTDELPFAFEPYVGIIPKYIQGMALDQDKEGRGAAILAEFYAKVLRRKRIKARKGHRKIRDGYMAGLRGYYAQYKRG